MCRIGSAAELLLAAPAPSDDRCADLVAKYSDYTPYELCPSEQVANGADPAATLAFASGRLHWKTVFWQVSKKGSRVDFIFQKPYHRKRLAV